MRIVFIKKDRTLAITDGKGQSLHKRGDNKIICSDKNVAHTVVEAISQLTGKLFYVENPHDDIITWQSI